VAGSIVDGALQAVQPDAVVELLGRFGSRVLLEIAPRVFL
jgi:hypothetical protein